MTVDVVEQNYKIELGSLFAPGRVEPAFGEDELGGVDSVFYLGERHMYGFPARLGQRLKPCEPRLEAFHSSTDRTRLLPI